MKGGLQLETKTVRKRPQKGSNVSLKSPSKLTWIGGKGARQEKRKKKVKRGVSVPGKVPGEGKRIINMEKNNIQVVAIKKRSCQGVMKVKGEGGGEQRKENERRG